jgi:hypothetical protein
LWCIQIRLAGDRQGGEGQRLDQLGLGVGRRGDRDAARVVDVVEQARLHAALGGGAQRAGHAVTDLAGKADVIEGDIEALRRPVEKLDEPRADVLGPLLPLGECLDLDQAAHPSRAA